MENKIKQEDEVKTKVKTKRKQKKGKIVEKDKNMMLHLKETVIRVSQKLI